MVDDTTEHECAAMDYTVVRDEKPAEFVGDLAERGLEARNTIEGLRIAADIPLTSPSTVAKLSATAPSFRSCATKRCSISVLVSFSCSWVRIIDTTMPWPRPGEARPMVENPPPLAGAQFERVVEAARLVPPRVAAFGADLERVVHMPDMTHNWKGGEVGEIAP